MAKTQDMFQDQLFKARRDHILDAATQVFAQKGFHRATIKEIARQAGIADGTVYNYFENKPDLLLGILDRLNETQQRHPVFDQGLDQDFRAFFKAYLRHRLEVLWPNRQLLRALLPELLVNEELREQYYRQMVEPSLEAAIAHFQARVELGQMQPVDLPLTARAMAGLVLGLLTLHLLGDDHLEQAWEKLPETLTTLIFDGLEANSASD
jgi:TetR/AcrR family fatty acid metabolism transcriptional regulator